MADETYAAIPASEDGSHEGVERELRPIATPPPLAELVWQVKNPQEGRNVAVCARPLRDATGNSFGHDERGFITSESVIDGSFHRALELTEEWVKVGESKWLPKSCLVASTEAEWAAAEQVRKLGELCMNSSGFAATLLADGRTIACRHRGAALNHTGPGVRAEPESMYSQYNQYMYHPRDTSEKALTNSAALAGKVALAEPSQR